MMRSNPILLGTYQWSNKLQVELAATLVRLMDIIFGGGTRCVLFR
jgi:hypothetical protein